MGPIETNAAAIWSILWEVKTALGYINMIFAVKTALGYINMIFALKTIYTNLHLYTFAKEHGEIVWEQKLFSFK